MKSWSWPILALLVNAAEENVVLQVQVDADAVDDFPTQNKGVSYLSIDTVGEIENLAILEKHVVDPKPRYPYQVMGGILVTKESFQTPEKYVEITGKITSLLDELEQNFPCSLADEHCGHKQAGSEAGLQDDKCKCPRAEWSACVLRAAGHDFMDFNIQNGQGGSDGCVDFEGDPDNAGLEPCLFEGEHKVSINTVYPENKHDVSLADFLVIAAEAVMVAQRKTLPALVFSANDFEWGRRTARQCPTGQYNRHLPNPANGCAANEETFVSNLGLNWAETTALMGVHSLGRARAEHSGYSGWWSDPQSSRDFNNNYYHSLIQKGWKPDKRGNGKFQWMRAGKRSGAAEEMMLNTDMCLLYEDILAEDDEDCCAWVMPEALTKGTLTEKSDIEKLIKGNMAEPDTWCGFDATHGMENFNTVRFWCCRMGEHTSSNECAEEQISNPTGPGASHVMKFAVDEVAWLTAFTAAWRKATTSVGWRLSFKRKTTRSADGENVGSKLAFINVAECAQRCNEDAKCTVFVVSEDTKECNFIGKVERRFPSKSSTLYRKKRVTWAEDKEFH